MNNIIKTFRTLASVTQNETSERTGISQARLSRLETRSNAYLVQNVTLNEVTALARYFDALNGTGNEFINALSNETSKTVSQTQTQTR